MFSFRAERHGTAGRSFFEAEGYSVRTSEKRIEVVLHKDVKDDLTTLMVGPEETFARIFIMNSGGKTVDVVR